MFLLFPLRCLSVDYTNTSPCDCDVTDKCDLYCCCDKDCNETSIAHFKEQFCLQESVVPTKNVVCDAKGRISKSNKIETYLLNDEITCYSVNVSLNDKSVIENYSPSDLGTDSFAQYLPTVDLPQTSDISDNAEYPAFKNESDAGLLYVPFGVGSVSCNTFILIRNNTDYNTTCRLLASEIKNSNSLFEYSKVLSSQFCDYTNIPDCSSFGGLLLTIGSNGITGKSIQQESTVNFVFTSQSDPEDVSTKGSGYISGLDIASVTHLDLENPYYKYFKFNGYNVKFGGTNTAYYSTSSTLDSKNIFLYDNIFPTYASFPASGVSKYAGITLPSFSIPADSSAKTVIYTMMYKRYGYKTAFYYRFVNVTMNIVETPENLYHTVELRQVELSDDLSEPLETLDSTPYSPKFSQIFAFLFNDTTQDVRTIGVISLFIIIILVWLDAIFNQ